MKTIGNPPTKRDLTIVFTAFKRSPIKIECEVTYLTENGYGQQTQSADTGEVNIDFPKKEIIVRGPSINDATHLGRKGDLPKGDVTTYAYLVKWVTRGRDGSKISKNGCHHLWTVRYLFLIH